jgi:hypothetical protein
MKLTITEALAEVKSIQKRLEKKRAFLCTYVTRDSKLVDPLAKDGGSEVVLEKELQSYGDLHRRLISIRSAIQVSNAKTVLTLDGATMTVLEWIVWKREVAPDSSLLWNGLSTAIDRGTAYTRRAMASSESAPEMVCSISPSLVASTAEKLEKTLGELDGRLSLLNATTTIDN